MANLLPMRLQRRCPSFVGVDKCRAWARRGTEQNDFNDEWLGLSEPLEEAREEAARERAPTPTLRAHCKPLNDPEPSTPSRPEQPWPLERSKRGKFPKTRGSKATSSIGALLLFLPRAATSNRKFGTRPERRDRILPHSRGHRWACPCRCKITAASAG